jgi:ubiquinone/menaquinone biosynthesis C-methylase UbiE
MQRIPEPEYMDLPDEADAYAVADFTEVNRAFVEAVVAFAGANRALRAADLGTGPGDIPALVLRHAPAWHITGADASAAMLRIAREQHPGGGLAWVQCDTKREPFADAAFGLVFSNSILHHVADPVAFWREAARILQPGGGIFLRDLFRPATEADAWGIVNTYSGDESPLLKEEFFRSLCAAYTVGEVREQLAAAGIRGLDVREITDRHLDVCGYPVRS